MINLQNLIEKKQDILKGRYRVRLLEKSAVPVVCDIPDLDDDLIVLDLAEAVGYEAKVLDSLRALEVSLKEKTDSSADKNKENIPVGCVLKPSEHLTVNFLSIEKLDKLAANNMSRIEESHRAFELTYLDRFADFELHLVPQIESCGLINELSESMTGLFSLVIFSEGSGRMNILLSGLRKTPENLFTFKARYLGDYHHSINQLERLSSNFRIFPFIESKCRCRFDVLRDCVLLEKSGNIVPATFVIEAEWTIDKKEDRGKCVEINALSMPPNNATALIRFKPGWMDSRIFLTDRIIELRYLARLVSHLREGTSPWAKSEGSVQPAIIEKLTQLVGEETEYCSIYPFDFTDRLWDVLKLSKSFETLQRAFQLIYDRLQTGEFRVLVEANRVSSLAKMLRMRNPNDIIFPRLEPMTCLQLLVEIGVDRFNGELAYRFLQGNFLPNSSDLDPFFLRPSASLEHKIERLLPLYFALQSTMMISEYVVLPQHAKTNMAKQLLSHFIASKGTDAFEKEFVYKAAMEDIRSEEIIKAMSEWLVERKYKSETSQKRAASDAVFVSKSFGIKYLPPPPSRKKDDISGKVMKEEEKGGGNAGDMGEKNFCEKNKKEESPENSQFECIYLTVMCHPSDLFA